jgi:hypothetical protein
VAIKASRSDAMGPGPPRAVIGCGRPGGRHSATAPRGNPREPTFSATFTLNGSERCYGAFLTLVLHFLPLAAVLFLLVKLLKRLGLGNFRAQGSRECPQCKEFVPIDASKCKYCTADMTPVVADDEDEAP